jgi:signal transduction histidine kinase
LTNAYNFIYQKEFLKAEKQLLAAMDLAKTDSLQDPLFPIFITMSQVKFSQHDFMAGNYYEEKWDSLYNLNTEQQLSEYAAELETKYEVEKKESVIHHLETEKEIQQFSLQRKNSFIIYLISGFSALFIISFLTYRNVKHKQKIQQQRITELETQQQLTAAEAVLKGEEQERARIAKDLHDGLGGILSGIKFSFTTMKGNMVMTPENQQAFERSMDMLDSSIRELRTVAHNMMPEALLRFGLDVALKDFCYEINQSGALHISYQSFGPEDVDIDQTVAITLYRIVQELINNTMKHSGASSAIVQLTKSYEQLFLTVEDDGKGFDSSILKASKGIGWVSIKNRVDFLKGKLDITSKEGEGTSVHIEIFI